MKEKKHYEGIVIDVYQKDFNGFQAEILKHPGGVCIAAEDENGKFYMVKQFRFAVEKEIYEFPAGKIDPKEEPKTTALRELREEIGYQAQEIHYLGKIYPSPAYLDEVLYLYYAKDLKYVGQDLDEFEELSIHLKSWEEIERMIARNEIEDAKTLALFLKLKTAS